MLVFTLSNTTILSLAPILISLLSLAVSMMAMRRSKEAREGEIAQTYFSEYGSPQMFQDLQILSPLRGKLDHAFLKEFQEKRSFDPRMQEIDAARRRVKTHYLTPIRLYRQKLISESVFMMIIDSRGIRLLDSVVEPLTRVTDNLTNPELADFEYVKGFAHRLKWMFQYSEDDKVHV
jgi:hypothetical protein